MYFSRDERVVNQEREFVILANFYLLFNSRHSIMRYHVQRRIHSEITDISGLLQVLKSNFLATILYNIATIELVVHMARKMHVLFMLSKQMIRLYGHKLASTGPRCTVVASWKIKEMVFMMSPSFKLTSSTCFVSMRE